MPAQLICPDTGVALPTWTCPTTGRQFPTGMTSTPQQRMLAALRATPFVASTTPPDNYGFFPVKRSMFHNDRYGICVTSEEMFTKTCTNPEIDIDVLDQVGFAWAKGHGVTNGASLDEVCDWMVQKGFQIGPQLYNDGPWASVDYTNDTILKAAIYEGGPVKIAIPASRLPGGAGSSDGFWSLNGNGGGSDHCVALNAYGTAQYVFDSLKIPLPSGLPAQTFGYALYTWSTIGFVGPNWVKGVLDEAMVRKPTTVGVPPLAPPVPPTPPIPPAITGTIYAQYIGSNIVIKGEIATVDGSHYLATPIGGGFYKFVPVPVL